MINFNEKSLLTIIFILFVEIILMCDALNLSNDFVCIIVFSLFIISLTLLISLSFYIKVGFIGLICGVLFLISVSYLITAFIMGQVSWISENTIIHKILWYIGLPLLILSGGTTSITIIIRIKKHY
jgi:hypothetical protein